MEGFGMAPRSRTFQHIPSPLAQAPVILPHVSSILRLPLDEERVRHSSLKVRKRPIPGEVTTALAMEKSQSTDIIHL